MSSFSDIGFLSIRDPWLQNLLWEKMDPVEALQNPAITKLDMMKIFESQEIAGTMFYWGSKQANLVFRCMKPNEYVLEPHVVGSMSYLRTLMPIALDFIFTSTAVEKINIYTHIPTLRDIYLRYGFTQEGMVKRSVLSHGTLVDYYVLGFTKEDYSYE